MPKKTGTRDKPLEYQKIKYINFRVTETDYNKLKSQANETGLSISDVVRTFIQPLVDTL